jgi:Uma2 family endonuclease
MSVLAAPAGTITPPPARDLPPLRWTVADFHRVAATGVFAGRRPILVRGALLEQGPMNHPPAIALELIPDVLRAAFGAGWRVRAQLPLVLNQDTDPMPDVAVVRGSARTATAHPTSADLVLEVSDTTLSTDLTTKAELYATAGVADYWVLDLNARVLHVFRDPQPNAMLGITTYHSHTIHTETESATPLVAPAASVQVSALLPAA